MRTAVDAKKESSVGEFAHGQDWREVGGSVSKSETRGRMTAFD